MMGSKKWYAEWEKSAASSFLLACPRAAAAVGRSVIAMLEAGAHEQIPEGPSVFLLSLSGTSAAISI